MSIDVHVRPSTGATISMWLRRVGCLAALLLRLTAANRRD